MVDRTRHSLGVPIPSDPWFLHGDSRHLQEVSGFPELGIVLSFQPDIDPHAVELAADVLGILGSRPQRQTDDSRSVELVDVLAQRHDDVLAHLWGPNEIYVVGVRRP